MNRQRTAATATIIIGATLILCTVLSLITEAFSAVFVQFCVMTITLVWLAIYSCRHKLRLQPLIASVIVSFALLFAVSLIGFYKNSSVVGEFDQGGTWVTDRTIGTALTDSLDTSSFIASFFGYSCNSSYGDDCSDAAYLAGFGTTELVLAGGLGVGYWLTRKQG